MNTRRLLGRLLTVVLLTAGVAANANDNPVIRLETTLGNIDIELYPDKAPETVKNVLDLVDRGFYDGLIFHRVVAGFVIQAGGYDPDLTYREPPGTVVNESDNGLKNVRYSVAMARLADPDSADSQFFINLKDNPHLDAGPDSPGYTVFGQVIAGTDVVDEIELVDTHLEGGMAGVPEQDVIITHAERLAPAEH
jgi:peptidyl-prolyl cis-trans isomerase A (cyclophilin A)/peptidyl-prolyl cis-trans isomerase B (cyclophilin B)